MKILRRKPCNLILLSICLFFFYFDRKIFNWSQTAIKVIIMTFHKKIRKINQQKKGKYSFYFACKFEWFSSKPAWQREILFLCSKKFKCSYCSNTTNTYSNCVQNKSISYKLNFEKKIFFVFIFSEEEVFSYSLYL